METHFDVIVIGGGPAGLTAAIQAGRAGASTLLVEKSGVLGGTTVLNAVNFPGLFHAWGQQVIAGIGWDLVRQSVEESGSTLPDFSAWRELPHFRLQIRVNRAIYAALADEFVRNAGVALSLHTMLAAVEADNDGGWKLTLCGKEGLREIRTRVLIDCTGDANAISLAGLPVARNAALQPGTLVVRAAGYDLATLDLPRIEAAFLAAVADGQLQRSDLIGVSNPVTQFLQWRGENSVHVVGVDGRTSEGRTDAEVKARALILRLHRFFRAQPGLENFHYDFFASECGIRETCTIQGEARITVSDYLSGRVWEDAVCNSFYPIDVHQLDGHGIDTRPLQEGAVPTVPYRALLPRDSRNLIVAGRIVCGDQEANSAFRVQASAMATGQAAGAAAALAAKHNLELRAVPLAELHNLLRAHGAIVPNLSAARA
jgi:Dehydrogenases (flavoproteins)